MTDPITPPEASPSEPAGPESTGPGAIAARDEGLLIDWQLGQLGTDEVRALQDRLQDDPALAREGRRLERLLGAERARLAPELEAAAGDAPRIAARIRAQAGQWDRRPAATRPVSTRQLSKRQRRWVRVLALSIGAHVAALALIAFWVSRHDDSDGSEAGGVAARFVEADDAGAPDSVSALAEWFQDAAREAPIQVSDSVLLGAAEASRDADGFEPDLSDWDPEPKVQPRAPLEHPRDVAVSMWIRREPSLKSRRLTLLGFEATRTLRAVERGLQWLSLRQRADGSFEAPPGTSTLEQTAVALLPFLGDGHDSTRAVRGTRAREIAVVRDGVSWIRKHAFQDGQVVSAGSAALGAATMALCEDYMLGYARLRVSEAQTRAQEITRLVDVLQDRMADTATQDAPWALWGIDAALRTGLVPMQPEASAQFRAWVVSASTHAPSDAMRALSVGTAVLLADASPDKAGFRAWSVVNSSLLLEALLPSGRVRSGADDVTALGQTARMVLALQIAYRTY